MWWNYHEPQTDFLKNVWLLRLGQAKMEQYSLRTREIFRPRQVKRNKNPLTRQTIFEVEKVGGLDWDDLDSLQHHLVDSHRVVLVAAQGTLCKGGREVASHPWLSYYLVYIMAMWGSHEIYQSTADSGKKWLTWRNEREREGERGESEGKKWNTKKENEKGETGGWRATKRGGGGGDREEVAKGQTSREDSPHRSPRTMEKVSPTVR